MFDLFIAFLSALIFGCFCVFINQKTYSSKFTKAFSITSIYLAMLVMMIEIGLMIFVGRP